MRKAAENFSELRVPRSGHWIAEENADGFLKDVLAFLRAKKRKTPAQKCRGSLTARVHPASDQLRKVLAADSEEMMTAQNP